MPYMIKTIGGPTPGVRAAPTLDDLAAYGLSWPLPDELDAPGGAYVKVSESGLPESAGLHPNVGMGAVYEWRPKDGP